MYFLSPHCDGHGDGWRLTLCSSDTSVSRQPSQSELFNLAAVISKQKKKYL
jgi:hypothetical protein